MRLAINKTSSSYRNSLSDLVSSCRWSPSPVCRGPSAAPCPVSSSTETGSARSPGGTDLRTWCSWATWWAACRPCVTPWAGPRSWTLWWRRWSWRCLIINMWEPSTVPSLMLMSVFYFLSAGFNNKDWRMKLVHYIQLDLWPCSQQTEERVHFFFCTLLFLLHVTLTGILYGKLWKITIQSGKREQPRWKHDSNTDDCDKNNML